MADLAVWQRTIVDEEGNVVPGAEIEVRREEDDSLATLYADRAGESPLANPLAADMSGFVRFFAQGDAYTITAVGAGSTRTWRFDPTGRLQEFDRVSEALVADDAADLLSARANLGTFSSVADVQNSHIPEVLESIRAFGFSGPGVGAADYRRMSVPEVDQPGQIVSADGSRWALVGPEITAEACGAAANGFDDSLALQTAAAAAVAADATLVLSVGKTYSFSQLEIPAGCKVRAAGAKLRYLGSLPGADDISLTIGEGAEIDVISYSSAGAENNDVGILALEGARVGLIDAACDQQRGRSFVNVIGSGVWIDRIRTRNIDRPIQLSGGNDAIENVHIGYLEADSYVRGFRAIKAHRWWLGGYALRNRSANASRSPGHNGLLIEECTDWQVGDGLVHDSGEHAARVAGENGRMGVITAIKTGGCALKINPPATSPTRNIFVGGVHGIDVGEDSVAGGDNREVVRLSHCNDIRIGYITADAQDEAASGQYTLTLNDIDGLWVGAIAGDFAHAGIRFNKDSDTGPNSPSGPVRNVHIDSYSGTIVDFGTAVRIEMGGEEMGDIHINFTGLKGFGNVLASFSGTTVITGPVEFTGHIGSDILPLVSGAPDDERVFVHVRQGPNLLFGPATRMNSSMRGINLAISSSFDPFANSGQMRIGNGLTTAAQDSYGGAIEWCRMGSTRRGAAIAAKQTGPDPQNMGLAFFRGSGSAASDNLQESMVLSHGGNLSIVGALSKGSGTFCIDHPLDPTKRDLVHGFVEAPEYGLIYRGRVTLQGGMAEVDIDAACGMEPGTFASLTQAADVHSLTNRTGFASLMATEVVGGRFTIQADDPECGDEVAWLVYAARADDFIRKSAPWVDEDGRLVPSQEKPSELLGLRRHGGHAEEEDD